ncbi:hypothetical protein RIF29_36288 [Crotalaria pallida]|uniref:AAA ATPase AAA+ lid domain-containing protein n=1 Tax=Crotalaria pallida TaxID=3830 RepID=A0AAN9EBC0_CROPI
MEPDITVVSSSNLLSSFESIDFSDSVDFCSSTKGSPFLLIMVGLPSVENREMILKTLLAKEKHENLDFKELATMTEGYSGSDLKNLCITAAYRPVRELIQQERRKDMEKKKKEAEGQGSEDASGNEEDKDEREIILRALNMEDMRQAKSQVAASFASEGAVMGELKQWNDLYGERGSRKKQQLTECGNLIFILDLSAFIQKDIF